MAFKARIGVKFPARVTATTPIEVTKTGREYNINLNAQYLTDVEQAVLDAEAQATAAAASAAAADVSEAAAAASESAAAASEAAAAASAIDAAEIAAAASSSVDDAEQQYRSLVRALQNSGAGTETLELLYAHDNGLAIDMTADVECVVKDTTTPANVYSGDLVDWLPGSCFPAPKLCVEEDGTLKYSRHNLFIQSEDFGNASWTKVATTPTTGQTGPEGGNDAALLTTSSTTADVRQQRTELATVRAGSFVVKAGTSSWVYINISDGSDHRTWFDLANGVVGTNESGNSYEITNLNDDGEAYLPGWYHIRVSRLSATTNPTIRLGQSDADNTTNVTSGRTMYASRPMQHLGHRRQDYFANATAFSKFDIPFDWTPGDRQILIATANTTYGGIYSEDGTDAAWTKTNGTAALDATGPFEELCTTFTATSADATILQTYTNAGTNQVFAPYVRRKTGTGNIYATVDNGSNWTDITDEIGVAGGDYLRIYPITGGANPTYGFKIETSGDEIEFSLANIGNNSAGPSPPRPTYAAGFSATADAFAIQLSSLPSGSALVAMFDFWIGPRPATAATMTAGFRNNAGTPFLYHGLSSISATLRSIGRITNPNSVFSTSSPFGTWNENESVQLSLRYADTDCCWSANGEAPFPIPDWGGSTFHTINIDGRAQIWLKRLAFTPDYVGDAALRTEFLDTTRDTFNQNILAWSYISPHGTMGPLGLTGGWFNSRIPNGCKLYETDTEVGLFGVGSQTSDQATGPTAERPQRTVARNWTFDKVTHELTETTGMRVIHEETDPSGGWAAGEGGVEHPIVIKVEHGPNRGRLILLVSAFDPITLKEVVSQQTSDDNGVTWTAPSIILYPTSLTPSQDTVATDFTPIQFDEDSQFAGRIVVPLETYPTVGFLTIYTDDGGDTWTPSAFYDGTPGGEYYNEYAIAAFPDDTILVTARNNTSPYPYVYATSTDGGETFSAWAELPDTTTSMRINCQFVLHQFDQTGKFGKNGRMLWCGASDEPAGGSNIRGNYTMRELLNRSTMQFASEPDVYHPMPELRNAGYGNVVHLYDDVFALFIETSSSTGFNNPGGYTAMLVFRYTT